MSSTQMATLNRARLAKLAFEGGRLSELNAIVHPAVIAAQQQWMEEVFARDPSAVAVVESALIFEVSPRRPSPRRKRFRACQLAPPHRPRHRRHGPR